MYHVPQGDASFSRYLLSLSIGYGIGGIEALIDASRRKPNPKNRVEEATEVAVTAFAIDAAGMY